MRPGISYLPWLVVVNPEKSTTHRIVYDGGASGKGERSLNECLESGENLIPSLIGCLQRLRSQKFVFLGDVEKAYLQLRLHEDSRDLTRFLYVKDPSKPAIGDNLAVFRFSRVPFGLTCSGFILAASIHHHASILNEDLAHELTENTYVDDVTTTAGSTEELIMKYNFAIETFKSMKMNLRKLSTNNPELKKRIQQNMNPADEVKVLGMRWKTSTDELKFECRLPEYPQWTKRTILKALATPFDPTGILQVVTLKGKLLLQAIWKEGYEWDEDLPPDRVDEWVKIREETTGTELTTPRFFGETKLEANLAVFVDASSGAFGAVAYIRSAESIHDEPAFVMAKTRLTPIKGETTIPRLELLAILLGVKLAEFLKKELRKTTIKGMHLFSDSMIALHWTTGQGKFKTFVENRVRQIRETVEKLEMPVKFHHVSTEDNVADLCSRGLSAEEFKQEEDRWLNGPAWLAECPEKWPPSKQEFELSESDEDPEVKPLKNVIQVCAQVEEAPPWAKFGDFLKQKVCTAWYLKFVKYKFINKPEHYGKLEKEIPELKKVKERKQITGLDLRAAEHVIMRQHQATFSKKFIGSCGNLRPFRDENGLWRSAGRLERAAIADSARRPIIIDGQSEFAEILALQVHRDNLHSGADSLLRKLRERVWITQGRAVARRIVRECITCQKKNALPFKYPEAPDLPESRVTRSKPFENIGIDYAGPLMVKNEMGEEKKVWIFLATCLAVRAIHVELVDGLTTDAFLRAFLRFTARRGVPKKVLSDNAKTFKLGEAVLKKVTTSDELKSIDWEFTTPLAPWKGSIFERAVGLCKATLEKVMGKKVMKKDELLTVLTQVEAVVNERPLYYVSDDPDSRVLRPVDFLQPEVQLTIPVPRDEEEERDPTYGMPTSAEAAIQRWQDTVKTLDEFWKLWQAEYLAHLREKYREKNHGRGAKKRMPEVGELVLVSDKLMPRYQWPTARIEEVNTSEDGEIRTVKVRLGNRKLIKRAINQLIPLGVGSSKEEQKKPKYKPAEREEAVRREEEPREPKAEKKEIGQEEEGRVKLRSGRVVRRVNYREASESEEEVESAATTTAASVKKKQAKAALPLIFLIALLCLPSTTATWLECVKGGVKIYSDQVPTRFQVCADGECTQVDTSEKTWTHLFNPSITMKKYFVHYSKKASHPGQISEDEKIECPSSNFCEHITCVFCSTLLANPQCYPWWTIFAAGILTTLLILCCHIFIKIFECMSKILEKACEIGGCIKSGCGCLWNNIKRCCRRGRQEARRQVRLRIQRRRQPRGGDLLLTGLTIMAIARGVQACQEAHTFSIKEEVCRFDEEGREICQIEHSQQIFLSSVRRLSCLRLKRGDIIVGQIEVELLKVKKICEKRSLFFSRDVAQQVGYHRRDISDCGDEGTQEHNLKEFAHLPGYSKCAEARSFLSFPDSFDYRIYATHENDDIYEIFSCEKWSPIVVIEVKEGDERTELRMAPHVEQKVEKLNLSITILDHDEPTIKSENAFFVSKGQGMAVAQEIPRPSLQCSTSNDAKEMPASNCTLLESCECAAERRRGVVCTCITNNPADQFENEENVLPLKIPGATLDASDQEASLEGRTSAISTFTGTSAHVLLKFAAVMEIARISKNFGCVVSAEAASGCYNCMEGARTTITCTSKKPVYAELNCLIGQFALPCGPEGRTSEVRLEVLNAELNISCSVGCGKEKEELRITGRLAYVGAKTNYEKVKKYVRTAGGYLEDETDFFDLEWPDWSWPDAWSIAIVLAENWRKCVVGLVIGAFVIVNWPIFSINILLPLSSCLCDITKKIIKLPSTLVTSIRPKNKPDELKV